MKIALSYAMPGEIESLLAATGAKLLETVHGVPFYEIERDIIAYAGGVGKVNAAMAAQLCIDRCQPDWIVNAGVAGTFRDLPLGTVVVAERFLQHDVDTSPVGLSLIHISCGQQRVSLQGLSLLRAGLLRSLLQEI